MATAVTRDRSNGRHVDGGELVNASLMHIVLGRRRLKRRSLINAANWPTTSLATAAMTHWQACGDVEVALPPRNGTPARRAHLQVSIGAMMHRKARWVARFWEKDAPEGAKSVDWLFASQQPLSCMEDALRLLRNRPDLVVEFEGP